MIIDLEQVRFVDPYGMVGLLALARFLRQHSCEPVLMLPRSDEVMKYLDRMDFSRHAERLCAIDLTTLWPDGEYSRSTHSDVLLEITPIARSEDIHYIVERVRERAQTICPRTCTMSRRPSTALSWRFPRSVRTFPSIVRMWAMWRSRNTSMVPNSVRNSVKIAVMDLGVGFRASLGAEIRHSV